MCLCLVEKVMSIFVQVVIHTAQANCSKILFASLDLNYLYNRGCYIQTPPRQSSTDPKPVCHFDPLLMVIDVGYRAFGLVVN